MRLLLASLVCCNVALAQTVVPWTSQTSSIASTQAGDPAFVSLPRTGDAGVDLIIGTDTAQTGVYTWNADGQLKQLIPLGLVAAADARGTLVVVAQSNGALITFEASADGGLTRLLPVSQSVPTPGHVALRALDDAGFEVWVDTSSPTLRHFALNRLSAAELQYFPLADVAVPQTPSGLAVDDRTGRVYVALPTLGVVAVEPDQQVNFVISIDAGQLGPVVGGLDLYPAADGGTLLFSTSPSQETIVVHQVDGLQATWVAAFAVHQPGNRSVRARLPRHLDVYEHAFEGFPRGALIVHDGVSANYKLVSLADVDDAGISIPPPFEMGESVDAGLLPDGGTTDGGTARDGGPSGGGGGTGGQPGNMPGIDPTPTPCGCTGGPLVILPALLLLWWIRRPRS